MLYSILTNFRKKLIVEDENKRIIVTSTYIVLGLVSFVMTILNIITDKGVLTVATAVFALLCLLNLFLSRTGNRGRNSAMLLFALEIILLFTFFLVSGQPDGFSAIWIVMLPSLGMLFFGQKRGSILCVVMLVILIYLLWTPHGTQFLTYPYTDTFRMRFPILYTAFYLVALFLETIQSLTFHEVDRLQKLYQKQSMQDPLTGLLNRQGMYNTLESTDFYRKRHPLTVLMLDIDFFKQVNDTYGHLMGDTVLKELSALIEAELNAVNCRWGGEEFVSIYQSGDISPKTLEHFRKLVEAHVFTFEGTDCRITISMGVAQHVCANAIELDDLIETADTALYAAKSSGRNRIKFDASADVPAPVLPD